MQSIYYDYTNLPTIFATNVPGGRNYVNYSLSVIGYLEKRLLICQVILLGGWVGRSLT